LSLFLLALHNIQCERSRDKNTLWVQSSSLSEHSLVKFDLILYSTTGSLV